jgi:hypothetical protein
MYLRDVLSKVGERLPRHCTYLNPRQLRDDEMSNVKLYQSLGNDRHGRLSGWGFWVELSFVWRTGFLPLDVRNSNFSTGFPGQSKWRNNTGPIASNDSANIVHEQRSTQ